jgi:glycosyltransferase involved in cell wall biosynthesis
VNILVVTSGWPSEDRPEQSSFVADQVERLREAGLSVDVVTYNGRRNPFSYGRARRDVRHKLRSHDVDVVHAHFGQTGLVVLPSRAPVVATFYGSDLYGVVGTSGRYTLGGWALRHVSRWVAKKAKGVVLLSEGLAQFLPPNVTYEVIPLGVDTDLFRPIPQEIARADLGLDPDRKLVLFAGNPAEPVKRFPLASRAVAIASRSVDVELLTISGRTRREVAHFLSAVDTLLITSRHESGPLIAKEALACDTPVVSVDVGDVSKTISGLPGSALCPDDNPETIAVTLLDVLRREGPFEGRRVAELYSQRRMAEKLITVYERIVERKD